MDIRNLGTKLPREEGRVSDIAIDRDPAFALAQSLFKRARDRGLSRVLAYRDVARRVRVGAGTFENIVRERVKGVDGLVRDRLTDVFVRELQLEVTRLTNELAVARKGGARIDPQRIGEIETHLAQVNALLSEAGPAPHQGCAGNIERE